MAIDLAEVLTAISLVAGPDRAVRAALGVLEPELLIAALPVLQPAALSHATRSLLRRHEAGLLGDLRTRLATALGVPIPAGRKLVRVRPATVLVLLGAGFAVHLLLPQLGEVAKAWSTLRSSDWVLVMYAAGASAATYLAAALVLNAASPVPLPYDRCVTIAVAGSFANRFAPGGLGRAGLVISSINKAGASISAATSALGLAGTSGLLVHSAGLLILGALYGGGLTLDLSHPSVRWFLVVTAVLAGMAAVLLSIRRLRQAALRAVRDASETIRAATHEPRRLVRLLAGSAALNVLYIACFDISLRAVSGSVGAGEIALVYLGGAAVGAASPTPGGLGAEEVALTAGLIAAGSPTETAVAGVVLFRLLTYWAPILPGGLAFTWLQRRRLA